MQVTESTEIAASPEDVWPFVSNIENAGLWISGIKKIEILEVATGPSIVGLKWRETREWMGKDAVEVMWITDAQEPLYYQTRAESHGSNYTSRIELEKTANGTQLAMTFRGEPVTFSAKVIWALTGWMARKALCKTIAQDLADIKEAVEKSDSSKQGGRK